MSKNSKQERATDKPLSDSAAEHLICLDQFLRVCRLVGTGGQAKVLIQAGEVKLNGEVETRRRKKLFAQDVVEFQGKSYRVVDHVAEPDGSNDISE